MPSPGLSGGGEAVLLDPRAKLGAGQAEQERRLGLVVAGAREGLADDLTLRVAERHAARRGQVERRSGRGRLDGRGGDPEREVLARDEAALAQDHGALDGVPQLANVARP